jgi:hypothetical protein
MRPSITAVALALFVSALPVCAADVSGIWLGSLTTGRRNQVQDFAFQFVQKGTALTGKLYLDYGSTPILKGTIDGDQIAFQVVAREQDGNQINEAVLRFTGTLKDGEIEITREREELRNAGNAGASFSRPGKQTFRLKRLP